MRLLKSLTFDESHMKVNRKMTKEEEINQTNKKKGSVGNWFKQPSKGGSSDMQKIEPKYVYGQTQSSDGKSWLLFFDFDASDRKNSQQQ